MKGEFTMETTIESLQLVEANNVLNNQLRWHRTALKWILVVSASLLVVLVVFLQLINISFLNRLVYVEPESVEFVTNGLTGEYSIIDGEGNVVVTQISERELQAFFDLVLSEEFVNG